MNVVILSGRLTRNPEIRYGGQDSSTAIARFTLAVDDYQQTDYPSCKAIGKNAEWLEKWAKQGTKVELQGRVKTGHYTSHENKEVYYTEILVDRVGFGETKAEAENRQQAQTQNSAPNDGFMDIPDNIGDELPFN